MKSTISKKILVVLMGMILLFGLANSANSAEKVKISMSFIPHLTGAYGATQVGFVEGMKDCLEYLNSINYVPGVELAFVWRDGATDAAKTMAAFKTLMAETPKPVIHYNAGTPFAVALKKWQIKNKVPDLTPTCSEAFGVEPSWTFSPMVPYPNLIGAWVDYYLANIWKDKSRKPRYAIVTWDNSYGRMFATDKVKNYIRSRGVEIVGEEYIPLVPTDTTPQMLRIKAKKADFIGGNMYYTAAAVVLKDMKKLGILDKVKVGFAYGSAPNLLVKQVGKTAEGLYFVFDKYYFGDEPQKRGLVAWKKFKEKNRARITTFEQYFPGGWFNAHVMAEAIRIAAADVGPKNVDGTAVYNAIQKIRNFDGHGTSLPVSFDNKSHFGTLNRAIITTIKNGKAVNLGEIPAADLISNK